MHQRPRDDGRTARSFRRGVHVPDGDTRTTPALDPRTARVESADDFDPRTLAPGAAASAESVPASPLRSLLGPVPRCRDADRGDAPKNEQTPPRSLAAAHSQSPPHAAQTPRN